MIAAGAAAHSDHGRDVAHALLLAAEHPESGYSIKNVNKLRKVARILGVAVENRETKEIAIDVAQKSPCGVRAAGRRDSIYPPRS